MTILDDDVGERLRCDLCQVTFSFDAEIKRYGDRAGWAIKHILWREMWRDPIRMDGVPTMMWLRVRRNRPMPREISDPDYCHHCAVKLTPWVGLLRDIDEVASFNAVLWRTISEVSKRRKSSGSGQDYGPITLSTGNRRAEHYER